jgi:hypothetical protein
MKTINFLNAWTLSLIIFVAITVTSCKKTETASIVDQTEINNSNVAAQEDAESDAVYNGVFDDVMGADNEVGVEGTGFLGGRTTETGRTDSAGGFSCLIITRERLNPPALFPLKITYDFGAGCIGRNGQFRKGKIVIIYTGRLIVPGTMATTTFVNYQVDSFKIEGTHTIKNTSTLTVPQYEVGLRNGKITNVNNGKYKTRDANHQFTQVAGQGSPFFPLDDIFQIKGAASGSTNRPGMVIQWSNTILNIEPLIKKFTCHWFVQGKVKIERTGKPDAILDYGNGGCDNQATITINGNTSTITLPW